MENEREGDEEPGNVNDITDRLHGLNVEDQQNPAPPGNNFDSDSDSDSEEDSSAESTPRAGTPEPAFPDDVTGGRRRNTLPRAPPIQMYVQFVPRNGAGQLSRAAANDPLGPFSIPRITRPTSAGDSANLRYYNLPHGNEGIEKIDKMDLIPDWQAWAGWLGLRGSIRARWGSTYPIRRHYASRYPTLQHTSVRPPKKNFRVDYIPSIPFGGNRIFSKACRIAITPSNLTESHFNGDGEPIYYDSYWNTPESYHTLESLMFLAPTPVAGQPFDMFRTARSFLMDRPYGGQLADYTRNEVKLAAIVRCLHLYLTQGKGVFMGDLIGKLLLFGAEGMDPQDQEIEEELD